MTPSDDAWYPSTTFANAVAGGVARERRVADEPVAADWTAGDVTACAGDGDGPTIGEPLPKLNGLAVEAVDVTADGGGDGALPLPLPLPVLPPAAGLPLKLGLVARAGLPPLLLPVLPPAAGLPLKLGSVARAGLPPLLLPVLESLLPPAAGLPLKLGLVARAGLPPLLLPVLESLSPPAAGLPLKLGLVADGGTAPCRFARCAIRLALVRGALRRLCRPVRPP